MEKNIVHYKPFNQRVPDTQYRDLLEELLRDGKKKTSKHASLSQNQGSGHKYCHELPCRILSYDLAEGVPIIPIRDLGNMWRGAIGEVVGFINGARTLKELVNYGCPPGFWRDWVTEEKCSVWGLNEGDLGRGSYGQTLTSMPMFDISEMNFLHKFITLFKALFGIKKFDQILALERQLKENPFARTNLISTWYPPLALGDKYQDSPRNVVVAPCHGNMIQIDVMDDRSMHMTVYQRSADTPVGLGLNLAEWVAFGMMVAYIANLKFVRYSHVLPNPQIYDIQFGCVEELIARTPLPLPSLYLRPEKEKTSLKSFRKEDFVLEDYYPHPKMKIPALI